MGRGTFVRTKNMQVVGHSDRLAHGDVVCLLHEPTPHLDDTFPLSVECKKEEGWDFIQLLKGSSSTIFHRWWEQSSSDAALWNKIPVVVFSKNFAPDFIMYPIPTSPDKPNLKHLLKSQPEYEMVLSSISGGVGISLLSEFLNKALPGDKLSP